MSLLQITLVLVTLINLVYVLIAAHLLNQVLKHTETSKQELLRAAEQSIQTSQALGTAARRTITEMERIYRTHYESDKSLGREVHELGQQIQLLTSQVQSQRVPHPHDQTDPTDQEGRPLDDGRAKLRADLNTALSLNHQLQHELDLTHNRLNAAIGTHRELQTELQDRQLHNRSLIEGLHRQLKDLAEELLQAQARAQKAEKHAEDNAVLLDEVRLQLHEQWQRDDATNGPAPAATGFDQSGLIDSQQQQIDALAEREKRLMAQIAQLEDTIARNQAEKTFIEERFLQIDAQLDAAPPTGG